MIFQNAFIDFDHTIYNTWQFTQDVYSVLVRFGIPRDTATETMKTAIYGDSGGYFDYTFERHLGLISALGYSFHESTLLQELQSLLSSSYQADDAEYFLEWMKGNSKRVILLTAGNESFQRLKLKTTNLLPYFDEVKILQEKKEDFVRDRVVVLREQKADAIRGLDDGIHRHIFVNDELQQNILVHKQFPNVLVLTKRHPVKYTDHELETTGIPYFDTLSDIMRYVQSIF